VQRAQFDFSNVAASGIDLLRDQGRAFHATARFALRNVTAASSERFVRQDFARRP
jgi:hypothetical protein